MFVLGNREDMALIWLDRKFQSCDAGALFNTARVSVSRCGCTNRTIVTSQRECLVIAGRLTEVAEEPTLSTMQYSSPQSRHLRMYSALHSIHTRPQSKQSLCTPICATNSQPLISATLKEHLSSKEHDGAPYCDRGSLLIPTCHQQLVATRYEGKIRHRR